ncbi:unnamed protein product, partial [Brassica oleracea var. botrytis]
LKRILIAWRLKCVVYKFENLFIFKFFQKFWEFETNAHPTLPTLSKNLSSIVFLEKLFRHHIKTKLKLKSKLRSKSSWVGCDSDGLVKGASLFVVFEWL